MEINNIILELHKKRPIKKILHLGAHLGDEIEFYKQLNPDVIYWFEANPELTAELTNNVMKHDVKEQKIFPYAVSSESKKMNFNLIYSEDNTNTGCSSLMELKEHSIQYPHIKKIRTIEVDAVNIDDFLIKNNLFTDFDYINMDIQGAEYEVLSSSKILFNNTPNTKIFQLETCKDEMYDGQKLESDIVEFMETKGYSRIHYHVWAHNWGDSLFYNSTI
jgi:FkbM family methyltransferase